MNDRIISLYINTNEITPEQFNCIVSFISRFYFENPGKIEVVCDKFPLRLNGKLSHLTSKAREYFYSWNKKNRMRNIGSVGRKYE